MRRRNRSYAVILLMLLAAATVALCGLVLRGGLPETMFTQESYTDPVTTAAQPTTRSVELTRSGRTRYHYARLNEAEQRAYRDICQQLPGFPESVEVTDLDTPGLKRVFQALLLDQPLLFQISSTHYKTRTVNGNLTAFLPEYRMGPEEYREKCKALAAACAAIPADGSEFERELAIHDALVRMCDYTEEDRPERGTAYGALVEHAASCEGYSRAMLLLLELHGVEACIVTGDAVNGGGQAGAHAWNQVRVDGAWYHLDATWDDPVTPDAPNSISHAYFNLPDADISRTHELTAMQAPCTSVAANYFVRMGLFFTGFDKAAETVLAQRLAEALAAGDNVVELRMSDGNALQNAKYELFEPNGPQRVYRVLSNAALSGHRIRTDYVRHAEISALYVIRILPEWK